MFWGRKGKSFQVSEKRETFFFLTKIVSFDVLDNKNFFFTLLLDTFLCLPPRNVKFNFDSMIKVFFPSSFFSIPRRKFIFSIVSNHLHSSVEKCTCRNLELPFALVFLFFLFIRTKKVEKTRLTKFCWRNSFFYKKMFASPRLPAWWNIEETLKITKGRQNKTVKAINWMSANVSWSILSFSFFA